MGQISKLLPGAMKFMMTFFSTQDLPQDGGVTTFLKIIKLFNIPFLTTRWSQRAIAATVRDVTSSM